MVDTMTNTHRRTVPDATGQRLLIVDAGFAAGWRRASASFAQLDSICDAAESDGWTVVVLSDSGFRHDLPREEIGTFETRRRTGKIITASAGCVGGTARFIEATAERAAKDGRTVGVLTARRVSLSKAMLARPAMLSGKLAVITADSVVSAA